MIIDKYGNSKNKPSGLLLDLLEILGIKSANDEVMERSMHESTVEDFDKTYLDNFLERHLSSYKGIEYGNNEN